MGSKPLFWAILGLFLIIIALTKLPISEPQKLDQSSLSEEAHDSTPIKSSKAQASAKIIKKPAAAAAAIQHPAARADQDDEESDGLVPVEIRKVDAESHEPLVENIPQEEELKSFSLALEDRNWKIWGGITAIPRHQFVNKKQGIAGQVNNYMLVKAAEDFNLESFNPEHPLVVYNQRLHTPGVVTGTLTVKLKAGSDINSVLADYELKVLDSFSQINLYYVTSRPRPFNLSELFKSLQQDSRIEKVDAEILDRQYDQR